METFSSVVLVRNVHRYLRKYPTGKSTFLRVRSTVARHKCACIFIHNLPRVGPENQYIINCCCRYVCTYVHTYNSVLLKKIAADGLYRCTQTCVATLYFLAVLVIIASEPPRAWALNAWNTWGGMSVVPTLGSQRRNRRPDKAIFQTFLRSAETQCYTGNGDITASFLCSLARPMP